jgi:ketosteroid isomerase-like protein
MIHTMGGSSTSETLMSRFNDAINSRDLEGLMAMMTDDHEFVDSGEGSFKGREVATSAWRGFFSAFPDYRNDFERIVAVGDIAVAVGRSVCPSHSDLDGPALWSASTRDGKVAQWRVYDDTPENREQLGLGS